MNECNLSLFQHFTILTDERKNRFEGTLIKSMNVTKSDGQVSFRMSMLKKYKHFDCLYKK